MAVLQSVIDAWYDNFIQQISRPPIGFSVKVPEDVGRLFVKLDVPKESGEGMENPVPIGESLYEKRNELYEKAFEGKLFVFPLASFEDVYQIRTMPAENLVFDVKNDVINQQLPPKPVEQKLGFFKNLLFRLFGMFKAEVQQNQDQFMRAASEYNGILEGHRAGNMDNGYANTVVAKRMSHMRIYKEMARANCENIIEDLHKRYQNNTHLAPFEQEGYQAKLQLFTALRDHEILSKEQCLDILTKCMVSRLGEYKDPAMFRHIKNTELQRLFHEQPEKVEEYANMIRNSPEVQTAATNGMYETIGYCFSPQGLDELINSWLRGLENSGEQMKEFVANTRQMRDTLVDSIESLDRELLQASKMKSWEVEASEAMRTLLVAQQNGTTLNQEQCEDILSKIIVGRLGKPVTKQERENPSELQKLLDAQPEKAKEIGKAIKNTAVVKKLAEKADVNEILQHVRTQKERDKLVQSALSEVNKNTEAEPVKDVVNEQVKEAESLLAGPNG